ncbi:hypothetical protein ACFFWA_05015 [Actinomadura verrucosospora]|uniref:hypothetical protein n=1 Tax=Actinomadura verrucosospora TaxID=46165 RepID=UPI0031EB9BC7
MSTDGGIMGEIRISEIGGDLSGTVVNGDHALVVSGPGSTVNYVGTPPDPAPRKQPHGRPLPRAEKPLGRDRELHALEEGLADRGRVQVYGERGSGKTTLLCELAARQAKAGRSVVYLPVADVPAEDVIQEVFKACYAISGYRPAQDVMVRLMSSIEALLVLDDYAGTSTDLADLLAAVPSCDIAVAGPTRLLFGEGTALELRGLDADAARDLLVRKLGRDLRDDELAAADELRRATGGRPLALVRAAATMRADGLHSSLDPGALTEALAAALNAPARAVLGLLCAVDGVPVPLPLLTALVLDAHQDHGEISSSAGSAATSENPTAKAGGSGDVAEALSMLEHARLVSEGPLGYTTTDKAATEVAALAGSEFDAAGCAARLADWAKRASIAETSDVAPLIVRVLRAALEAEAHAPARDLARAAAPRLALSLHWGSWTEVLSLGLRAARALGSTEDESYFKNEQAARLKAAGKGAAIGGAAATAVVAHKALAGHAAQTVTKPKGTTPRLLAKPAVSGIAAATGVAAVVGGIGYMGLRSPTPLSGEKAAQPQIVESSPSSPQGRHTTFRPPGQDEGKTPPRNGDDPTRRGDPPPAGPDPGPDPKPPPTPSCDTKSHTFELGNILTFQVPQSSGWKHFEPSITWKSYPGWERCWGNGDIANSKVDGPDRQYFIVKPIDCPLQLRPDQSCRFSIDIRLPDYMSRSAYIRVPVPGRLWGIQWDLDAEALPPESPTVQPSPDPSTT